MDQTHPSAPVDNRVVKSSSVSPLQRDINTTNIGMGTVFYEFPDRPPKLSEKNPENKVEIFLWVTGQCQRRRGETRNELTGDQNTVKCRLILNRPQTLNIIDSTLASGLRNSRCKRVNNGYNS